MPCTLLLIVALLVFVPALTAVLLSLFAGVVLIVSSAKVTGWRRAVLLVLGLILALWPVLPFLDSATGSSIVTVTG